MNRWVVGVHDPLKSLVTGSSLVGNCYIANSKTSFTIHQGELPSLNGYNIKRKIISRFKC